MASQKLAHDRKTAAARDKPQPATNSKIAPVKRGARLGLQYAELNPGSISTADVMQLQRDVGNEMAGQLLAAMAREASVQPRALHAPSSNQRGSHAGLVTQRFASGEGTIQRLGPNVGASSAALVTEYNNLLNSATFQSLNQIVTKNQNIILLDSSATQATDYTAATHTIQVPVNTVGGVARPLADVRDDIMWEMHNASIKGALGRTAAKFWVAPPGPGASSEEKKNYPYMQAAYALSTEWEEWINIAEHDLRVQAINADVAMAALGPGPHVTRAFGASFGVFDAGWYNFSQYLTDQIAAGHTTGYDPNAANVHWVGKAILSIAKAQNASALKITEQQVKDWRSGKRTKIKSVSNNPFKSLSIIKEARKGT